MAGTGMTKMERLKSAVRFVMNFGRQIRSFIIQPLGVMVCRVVVRHAMSSGAFRMGETELVISLVFMSQKFRGMSYKGGGEMFQFLKLSPDHINGLIVLVGAGFTWRNAWQLWIDRELFGVYWPTSLFFTVWGIWNLYYYPSLGQWFSFYAGILLALGNAAWVIMAVFLLRKKQVFIFSPRRK